MTPREVSAAVNLVRNITLELEGATTPEMVRLGAEFWALSQRLKVWTETIKDRLRNQVPHTPGQHLLRGTGAICTVTVQATQPVFRPGTDVGALRRSLGEDFGRLFDVQEIVTPREDFEETLQGVDEAKVPAVLAAVDLVNHKPRMSFHKV